MNLSEAQTLLRASEALVKAGRGVCSQKTYADIASLIFPQYRKQILNGEFNPSKMGNLMFYGIELSVDPFMEDDKILPVIAEVSMWKVRPSEERQMTAKEKLVAALREAEASDTMIEYAQSGGYDDFESDSATPIMDLVRDCRNAGFDDIARRARNGEFDGGSYVPG